MDKEALAWDIVNRTINDVRAHHDIPHGDEGYLLPSMAVQEIIKLLEIQETETMQKKVLKGERNRIIMQIREEITKEIFAKINERVGFLRQWLNELNDKELVTDENITKMLFSKYVMRIKNGEKIESSM